VTPGTGEISRRARRPFAAFTRIDALLLLMAVIWGTNYSIVKAAFRELDPQAFNAARMVLASSVFLAVIGALRNRPAFADRGGFASFASVLHTPALLTRRDWLELAFLGLVGHCCYQYCFIGGLALTSVANSSLMLAATPVVIALLSAALGLDRISGLHWIGVALSMAGVYYVVGRGLAVGSDSIAGDLLMIGAVICWAIYTLGAKRLMLRHSPVGVTGLSMSIGTVLYVAAVWPHLRYTPWLTVSGWTWAALVYSALFALGVAYTIWYAAVREIGSARTAVYSNVIPIVAMVTAVVFLDEPLGGRKLLGAAAVLGGVALTRISSSRPVNPD
jgi:drug/metabolite transporter (DMT)-like permease